MTLKSIPTKTLDEVRNNWRRMWVKPTSTYALEAVSTTVGMSGHNWLDNKLEVCQDGQVLIRDEMLSYMVMPIDEVVEKYINIDGTALTVDQLKNGFMVPIRRIPSMEIRPCFQIPVDQEFKLMTNDGRVFHINRQGIEHGDGDVVLFRHWAPDDIVIINGEKWRRAYCEID